MTVLGFWAHPIWDHVVYRNTLREYAVALTVVLGLAAAAKLYAMVLSRRLALLAERTATSLDDAVVAILNRAATPIVLVTALFALANILTVPRFAGTAAHWIFLVTVTWYGITSVIHILDALFADLKNREGDRAFNQSALHHIRLTTRIVIWIVGFLLIIRNLGYDITSLMAGFGIAGIAVALAVQNLLGDLFSYIMILVDKPFEIGDFIIIGSDMGVVEHIGIRSTRIRTLQGQELIVANADLTSTRINNYKKMQRRRVIYRISVVYGTPIEKLRAMPEWIREIMDSIPGVQLDRVHFATLGASSLDFEMAFFIESAEYSDYMNVQQEFNLRIYAKCLAEGVQFAFPTQTIHLAGAK